MTFSDAQNMRLLREKIENINYVKPKDINI